MKGAQRCSPNSLQTEGRALEPTCLTPDLTARNYLIGGRYTIISLGRIFSLWFSLSSRWGTRHCIYFYTTACFFVSDLFLCKLYVINVNARRCPYFKYLQALQEAGLYLYSHCAKLSLYSVRFLFNANYSVVDVSNFNYML